MILLALLLCLAFLVASSNGVVGNSVSIQNTINPDCILLSQCPELLWLLQNKHSVPGMQFQQVLKYLQNQQCGYVGNHPKVICPKSEDLVEDEVSPVFQMRMPSHLEQIQRGDVLRTHGVIDTRGKNKPRS